MQRKTGLKMFALLVLLGMALALVSACGGDGVSEDELNAANQQVAAKEQEVASLQQQLQAAQTSGQQATALQQQLSAKEEELATLQQELQAATTAADGVVWYTIPDSPPRATRTPVPPGFVAPPPPQLPADYSAPRSISFYVDTVTSGKGESKFKVDASLTCVRSGAFHRGQHIVWRMEVFNTSTGSRVSGDEAERAVLMLPHGEEINFRFARHGRTNDAPWFWTAAWDVPMDYPLGTIDYAIEAVTKDGKDGTFKKMPPSPAKLTVVE